MEFQKENVEQKVAITSYEDSHVVLGSSQTVYFPCVLTYQNVWEKNQHDNLLPEDIKKLQLQKIDILLIGTQDIHQYAHFQKLTAFFPVECMGHKAAATAFNVLLHETRKCALFLTS